MTTFGARLHAAVHARGPLCAGIDPHAALLRAWGLDDDVAGLERFALTAAEALAPRVAVVKPQSAFYERFGSRGIAVLERLVGDLPATPARWCSSTSSAATSAPPARRTPTPTSTRPRRWPSTRSPPAPTSASAR